MATGDVLKKKRGRQENDARSIFASRRGAMEGLVAAVAYIFCSLVMTSLTKYAASVWQFPGSSSLLLVECLATVAFMSLWDAGPKSQRTYQPFRRDVMRHLPLVTLAKAVNMYLSFVAMKRTSVPVYNVLKRLQPVYALLQDYWIRGTSASSWEFVGVGMMCLGTVVTGSGDLDYDPVGYLVALLASACQSLYLVLARHAQDEVRDLSHTDLLFYTAFYNCVLFLPLSAMELPDIRAFLNSSQDFRHLFSFLVPYVVLGAALNFATFWCTSANSPLSTAVAGSAKGILSTLVGMMTFGAHLNSIGWLGLVGNTAGGLTYSIAQAVKRRQADDAKAQ